MARISWKDPQTGEKAQFVADVLNDSLFNYAFDSNKVPSLNFRFFCMDYLSTFSLVEEGVMLDGNMQPLNEEFEYIISQSPWLPYNISTNIMSFRNKDGYYKNIQKENKMETKTRASYYNESAKYIEVLLSSDKNYLLILIEKIEDILKSSTFTLNEKEELYFCIREFISELINRGYSKEHLYNRTRKKLFVRKNSRDDIKYIVEFLKSLISSPEEYTVVFGVSSDVFSEFKDFVGGLRQSTEEEKDKLKTDYVIETKTKAIDPVSALKFTKQNFLTLIDIHNACIHNNNMQIACNGLVKCVKSSTFSLIKDSLNLLTKSPSKTKEERLQWTKIAVAREIDSQMLNALSLHNNALKIEESQTQLLSLWTIFEVLIDTKQSFMNRSNYITNILCSVLCISYYHHIIDALYQKIKLSSNAKQLILTEPRGNTPIEKLAFILKDNTAIQSQLKTILKEFPLEVYKIERYSDIFSSKEKMRNNLKRHSNRLRWQIMRIYRNRCMIVHNGTNFPYINNILENLHYYVDELLNYIFSKISVGIDDMDAIFSCARTKESHNMSLLEDKNTPLIDDDYYDIIFNF